LDKPFDKRLHDLMVYVTKKLVQETNSRVGYTQSDEISLLLYSDKYDSQLYFDGNVNKINSILASFATLCFHLGDQKNGIECPASMSMCMFDCRCFNVPIEEVENYFIWREQDAVRNSIEAAAQAHFSHKSLLHLHQSKLQEKLWQEKGINWSKYPACQKRGTYIRSIKTREPFSSKELAELPPKHNAHKNLKLVVERTKIVETEIPRLTCITNRKNVLLYGSEPKIQLAFETLNTDEINSSYADFNMIKDYILSHGQYLGVSNNLPFILPAKNGDYVYDSYRKYYEVYFNGKWYKINDLKESPESL
jgi:tRNA(His) 5'-end guanylyltransferase